VILYELFDAVGIRELLRRVYRITVDGGDHIPASGACILAANHESLADPFFLGVATTRPIHYMAKAELWRNRILAFLMDAFGAFPVERGGGDSKALGHGVDLLEKGAVLGIFPQGMATPRRKRPYLRGAARLALATGAPLVPVCMVNTEKALRPRKVKIGFPQIRILVAPPLRVERQRATVAVARDLTRLLEDAIADLRAPFGQPAHAWVVD
jgi:1-acyl-sn-glycerol-3-phosphate acyltransferase